MPSDLLIPPGHDTPAIEFFFSTHRLRLAGESYPEHAANFFSRPLQDLAAYLGATEGVCIEADFDLVYFNSSSTKILFRIFEMLDGAATRNQVVVRWHHDPEDDMVADFGQDLAQEFAALRFSLVSKG